MSIADNVRSAKGSALIFECGFQGREGTAGAKMMTSLSEGVVLGAPKKNLNNALRARGDLRSIS